MGTQSFKQLLSHSSLALKASAAVVVCSAAVVCAVSDPEESSAQEALALAQSEHSIVTADKVTLTGNVRASLVTVPSVNGEERALKLVGDKLVARGLSLTLPGATGQGKLTTGDAETTVTDGPVTVLASGLRATPAVENTPTIPVDIDLGAENVNDVLDQLGVPKPHSVPDANIPDPLMDHIALEDVTMELVNLTGHKFNAPRVQLNIGG